MRALAQDAQPSTEAGVNGSVATGWAEEALAGLSERGLRRQIEPLATPQGPLVRIGRETLINFSSNDYLGLAGDPRLAEAAAAGLRRHGLGSGASRLLVGDTVAHHALEERLARFMGSEAALVFNSGYAANVGILSTLAGPEDVIFSDALNHASMVDGCRLSRARTVIYPHGDVVGLDALIRANPARRQIICTESVFSMDGDCAPLRDLLALARLHGAALIVDEAHAVGVLGPRGAGLCEELGLSAEVDVRMGTLGKALGGYGAFVATSRSVAEWLLNRARSLVFSTALPPALCSAAFAAVDIVESDEALRARLKRNIRRFSEGLRGLGFDVPARSPIFPVVVGDPEPAVALAEKLRKRGVLAKAIRPPTVPQGTSRLRFSLSAGHSDLHIDSALASLEALEVRRER